MKFLAVVAFLVHSVGGVVVEQDDYYEDYDYSIAKPVLNFGPVTATLAVSKSFQLEKCSTDEKASNIAHLYSNESVLRGGALLEREEDYEDYIDRSREATDVDDEDYVDGATLTLKANGDVSVRVGAHLAGAQVIASSPKTRFTIEVKKVFYKGTAVNVNRTFNFLAFSSGALNIWVNAGAGFSVVAEGSATVSYSFDVQWETCVQLPYLGMVPVPCEGYGPEKIKFSNPALKVAFSAAKVTGRLFAFAGIEVEYASVVSTSLKLQAEAIADNQATCKIDLKWIFEAQALQSVTHFLNWVGDKWQSATGFCVRALDSAIFPNLLTKELAAKCAPNGTLATGLQWSYVGLSAGVGLGV